MASDPARTIAGDAGLDPEAVEQQLREDAMADDPAVRAVAEALERREYQPCHWIEMAEAAVAAARPLIEAERNRGLAYAIAERDRLIADARRERDEARAEIERLRGVVEGVKEAKRKLVRRHEALRWEPSIPEPFWTSRWLRSRPACYQCRITFGSREEHDEHWIREHYRGGPP